MNARKDAHMLRMETGFQPKMLSPDQITSKLKSSPQTRTTTTQKQLNVV